MPATYEPIATTTLSTTAANITFSSISSAYTDLRVVLTGTATAAMTPRIRFNSDTATNYSYTTIHGDGTSALSARGTSTSFISGTYNTSWSSTLPAMLTIDVFSYAGSTHKTCLNTVSIDQNGSGSVERIVGLWRSTAAITTLQVYASTSTFASGTTATLYGILKA